MKIEDKKLAAAVAAVYAHISTPRQVAPLENNAHQTMAQASFDQFRPNVWGISGRQSQMQANTMMLLRAFK